MKKRSQKPKLTGEAILFIQFLKKSLYPWEFVPKAWKFSGIGTMEISRITKRSTQMYVADEVAFTFTVKAPLSYWNSVSGRKKIQRIIDKRVAV